MNALSLFVTIVVIVSILALITIIWIKFGSWILSEILADNSVMVDVKGFVFFVNMNCPVESEYILKTQEDIDRTIHSKREMTLSDRDVEMVTGIIR